MAQSIKQAMLFFVLSGLALAIQGCGSPKFEGGMVKSNDQLYGCWKSESVKEGSQDIDTVYEIYLLDPNVFVLTLTDKGVMTSMSSTYLYDANKMFITIGDALSGYLDVKDDNLRIKTQAVNARTIMLEYQGQAKRMDPNYLLNGLWKCDYVKRNGNKDSSTKLDLRFRDETKSMLNIESKTGAQTIPGTYTYDQNKCLISIKDEGGAPRIQGTIIDKSGKMCIQTKDGVEYLFVKEKQ